MQGEAYRHFPLILREIVTVAGMEGSVEYGARFWRAISLYSRAF
ncbi:MULTISPECIES: hypothetical protein [Bartonella]|nr:MULTISPECIES: hypothetical protein [Bartonella]